MHTVKLIHIFLIFTLSVNAQILTIEEIENEDDVLSSIDLSQVKKFQSLFRKKENDRWMIRRRKEKKRVYEIKEYTPNIYLSELKRGTPLMNIKDKKFFKTQRNIYVYARELTPGNNKIIIYDKNKKPMFLTYAKFVHSLENDIQLLPKHDSKKKFFSKDIQWQSNDKNFEFDFELLFEGETMAGSYYSTLFDSTKSNAKAQSISMSFLPVSFLPVQIGLIGTYRNGSFETGSGKFSWIQLSAGPVIKWSKPLFEDYQIDFSLEGQGSLFHQGTYVGTTINFRTYEYGPGVSINYKTKIGQFLLGSKYKAIHQVFDSANRSESRYIKNDRKISSYSIFIGHKYRFKL